MNFISAIGDTLPDAIAFATMPNTRVNKTPAPRGTNASRQDGTATRQHMLEVAGQTFAELGFADTTSKEICRRAGTNVAAVNYHFGSKDELYFAVLVEAYRRVGTKEELAALAASKADPREKLATIVAAGVSWLSRESSWQFQVVAREMLSPSPLLDRLERNEVAPKIRAVGAVVAEIMQLPADHPAVAHCLFNIASPTVLKLVGYLGLVNMGFPDVELDQEKTAQYTLTFAVAGMEAVAKVARTESKNVARPESSSGRTSQPVANKRRARPKRG